MATFTVTIPDDILAEALAAAAAINQRQPANERQAEPLPFGDTEATDIVFQYLQNLIVANLQQAAAIAGETDVRAKLTDLSKRRPGRDAVDTPAGEGIE